MTQEVAALVRAMSGVDWDEGVLERLCRLAQKDLERQLRPGVAAQDCGGAFPVAAAWMALELLEKQGAGDVESFSAGDLTVKMGETAGKGRCLGAQARRLMAPYCVEEGFAFQGVPG